MRCLIRIFFVFLLIALLLRTAVVPARAADILGIHILNTGELDLANALLKTDKTQDRWDYVTIPFTLEDVGQADKWQKFFDQAREKRLEPIVRLATAAPNGIWHIPTRKNIVMMSDFLASLDWPQPEERLIVVFNEPNHSNEWGDKVDPAGYADTLQFAADWFHSADKHFKVLPAGLDLAAPNATQTMDAFTFVDQMVASNPDILNEIDGWTSHSYPNPAFSAPPLAKGKNSIYGFVYELDHLKQYTDRDLPVYITETGWVDNKNTGRWLTSYYQYAVQNIWSDPRVRAVTPFVLEGAPGAFSSFSFLDDKGQPTRHYDAYRLAIEKK